MYFLSRCSYHGSQRYFVSKTLRKWPHAGRPECPGYFSVGMPAGVHLESDKELFALNFESSQSSTQTFAFRLVLI